MPWRIRHHVDSFVQLISQAMQFYLIIDSYVFRASRPGPGDINYLQRQRSLAVSDKSYLFQPWARALKRRVAPCVVTPLFAISSVIFSHLSWLNHGLRNPSSDKLLRASAPVRSLPSHSFPLLSTLIAFFLHSESKPRWMNGQIDRYQS